MVVAGGGKIAGFALEESAARVLRIGWESPAIIRALFSRRRVYSPSYSFFSQTSGWGISQVCLWPTESSESESRPGTHPPTQGMRSSLCSQIRSGVSSPVAAAAVGHGATGSTPTSRREKGWGGGRTLPSSLWVHCPATPGASSVRPATRPLSSVRCTKKTRREILEGSSKGRHTHTTSPVVCRTRSRATRQDPGCKRARRERPALEAAIVFRVS